MKKTILYLMLSVVFYTSTFSFTYATLPVLCVSCIPHDIMDYITQIMTTTFSGLGEVAQTLDTVNNNVLKPMKDAMTLTQIVTSGRLVNTLITASTGGDPLRISNPKLYLQNKGIAITQGGIDALATQNGVFSNSIMSSIVAKAKVDNSSLANNLTAINQSTIPGIEKTKICNDAYLSAKAKSQVALTGGDYLTAKANLNNSLCTGNPATDPALAKRLIDESNQNPSMEIFKEITSGNNAYTKAQQSQIAISQAAEAAKTTAAKDISTGIKSQTTCTKFASNGLCIEDTVKQASSVITKAYTDALGSDMATKISSIGSGAGSIIGAAFNTISLVNGLTSAASSLAGSSGGSSGGGSGNSGTLGSVSMPTTASLPTTTSINTTYTSSTGYAQDLKNNIQSKSVISGAPKDLLKQHQKALDDLKKTDNNYLATISSYNSQLETVKSCYDNLISKPSEVIQDGIKITIMTPGFPATDARMVAGQNFYSQKKSNNDAISLKITAELKKIDITSTLIINTISIIDNSNSTDEITAAFKNYQDTVKNQDLPDITSSTNSLKDQMTFAGELQVSTMDGGEISNMKNTCTAMQQSLNTQNSGGNGL